jgi:hypothetical protein
MAAHPSLALQLSDVIQAILKSTVVTHHSHPPTTIFGSNSRDFTNHNLLLLVKAMEALWDLGQVIGKKQAFFDTVMPRKNIYLNSLGSTPMTSVYEDLESSSSDCLSQLMKAGMTCARTLLGFVSHELQVLILDYFHPGYGLETSSPCLTLAPFWR